MKERPIIFTDDSVQALRAGRKSQTRRLVNPQPKIGHYLRKCWVSAPPPRWREVGPDQRSRKRDERRCLYGVPGDRLWVKESFYCDHFEYPHGDREEMLNMISYRAGHDCRDWEDGCPCSSDGRSWWRSPLYMPRWASRITLGITDVRAERLNDISEDDARAEGVRASDGMTHRGAYAVAWDRINGKRARWATNPWVWVVSFEKVQAESTTGRLSTLPTDKDSSMEVERG